MIFEIRGVKKKEQDKYKKFTAFGEKNYKRIKYIITIENRREKYMIVEDKYPLIAQRK